MTGCPCRPKRCERRGPAPDIAADQAISKLAKKGSVSARGWSQVQAKDHIRRQCVKDRIDDNPERSSKSPTRISRHARVSVPEEEQKAIAVASWGSSMGKSGQHVGQEHSMMSALRHPSRKARVGMGLLPLHAKSALKYRKTPMELSPEHPPLSCSTHLKTQVADLPPTSDS